MKVIIKKKQPETPTRNGPGIIMGPGWGMAMAAKIVRERQIKEEKRAYAETHDGRKVQRRGPKPRAPKPPE